NSGGVLPPLLLWPQMRPPDDDACRNCAALWQSPERARLAAATPATARRVGPFAPPAKQTPHEAVWLVGIVDMSDGKRRDALPLLRIEVHEFLPLGRNDEDLGIVDHPRRAPGPSIVPVGDVEEEVVHAETAVVVGEARPEVVLVSKVFNPGFGVVVHLPVIGEGHPHGPPPWFFDVAHANVLSALVGADGDLHVVA